MFAKLKRLGNERVKFSLQCTIGSITLTDNIEGLQLLLVEYDRGGKNIRTPAKPPSTDGKTAKIDAVLNLSMTLWREKNGYQTKVGQLILKACTKNAYGLMSTVIGTVELPLHELAASLIPSSTKVMWFKNNKGKQVGMVEVSFHAKQLGSDASSECSDTSSQASWNCVQKKETSETVSTFSQHQKPSSKVTTSITTKSSNADTTKNGNRKVAFAAAGGPAPTSAVSPSRPAGKLADNPFDGKDELDDNNPFDDDDDDESLQQQQQQQQHASTFSERPISKSAVKAAMEVAAPSQTEDNQSLQLELRDAYQHIEDLQVQVDKLIQQVSSEKEQRRKAQAQGESADRQLQRVTAELAAVTATTTATNTDRTESAALIASLRTENKNLQKALEDAQTVLSKESALLSPSPETEKALQTENKNLQIALEEAQKDLDEFLSLFNSEKERFATEMAMMMDHEQQLLKENKRLDMAVERLNDREALSHASSSSQRNGSDRDSRSGGGDGINNSEHWKLVEQLRLAEEEHSRLVDYITELEQRQDGGGSGGESMNHHAIENLRLIDELAAAHTERGQMEERILLLEEREERYAEEIETLTVTLEDMERQKKMVDLDHNNNHHHHHHHHHHRDDYENTLLPSVKGGGEMVWMDALSEAGDLKKENQRLLEEVEHLSAALMDAQLSHDVKKRRMQRTDSQSDCDEEDDDDEDSDSSETSTHKAKYSTSQWKGRVNELENLVTTLQVTNKQLAMRIEHLDDEAVLERTKNEYQVTELLKAAGLYNKNGNNGLASAGGNGAVGRGGKNDQWFDLFRSQMDDERMKICALKGCLLRFVSKLSKEEQESLLDAGIILEPSQSYLDGGMATSEGQKQSGWGSFLKHI